ncbi:187-kDa microtubule-associated protein AIR9-like isoform X2 [Aristolochia californica]|uniref:187-kDa microtubule-associated protein AIR9-like isoform X2 n=1 Tax=Aristolochia californica TaxID=171875 RepID=UPI0035E06461
MEDHSVSSEELVKQQVMESGKQVNSAERVKKSSKTLKTGGSSVSSSSVSVAASKRRVEASTVSGSSASTLKSAAGTKSSPSSNATSSLTRRNSAGGVLEKQRVALAKPGTNGSIAQADKLVTRSRPNSEAKTDSRRASLPSSLSKASTAGASVEVKKPSPASASTGSSATSLKSEISTLDSTKKTSIKSSISVSTTRRIPSSSLDSSGSSSLKRIVSKIASPSACSPSVTSSLKLSSLSSSVDRGSSLSGRRKTLTPDSRESRFMMLPQVEVKAGDDVRLDFRGHRVRSLKASGLNLSQNLEFVYLRDNLLSSLEGIEILKRVKVLDLSFNDFKGAGFEPLENCKALQQLYLAGNQITSLMSLPELPNLEFLSVAQNRLKSLSMASQPRLQVLAASKNKISTLQGFPHLPALEHLRVEENPILKMPHLEAACTLLAGPTFKKFNDKDLSRDEVEIAKRYPAHTALCIRDGWEFCRPELAVDSTFCFLIERWKDHLPPGYMLKEASVDQPFEEDVCRCHFIFTKEHTIDGDSELVLKFQWFIGERTPTNFVPIADAVGEVYWAKYGDIGKFLKVECTPIVAGTEYSSIFAISSPVSPGTGYPKVINLNVHGELVEGNVIKGSAEVAWCGGTPGKGVASWLRRRWNSSPVVIVGAEEEEYSLTLDDVDSSLVFMYTPVTEEGAKGEPHYAMMDFVKAAPPSVCNVRILGDIIEGSTIKGVGDYFGGREGPSKFEWLRENKESSEFVLVSTGTAEYALTKEDVGRRLAFVYIPINFEGQEGESVSTVTDVVLRAPPKVTNLKIVGDLREGGKVNVSANLTGGSEGSSRVQWFKTRVSNLEGENGLEALTASKIAKAFRIPLSAADYYIVVKFTPMAPDGESGEQAFAISEKTVETLPPSLNFLSVTGDYSEGEMLTASYGYIGGHEGKSLYNWYLHEGENEIGVQIPEASGLLQYRITKEAIGKFVSFKCIPVRDDGAVGEPRTCLGQEHVRPGSPRLLSLQIVGEEIEASVLNVYKKYWGGEEGDSVSCWFVTSPDGTVREIKSASAVSYTPSKDDIGCFISVSCEPVRSDWARGPAVISEKVGPILPGPPTCLSLELHGSMMEGQHLGFIATYSGGEIGNCIYEWYRVKGRGLKDKISGNEFLDLALEDVGKRIELVYIPMRKDGLRGKEKSIVSDVISPGLELLIPDCSEDKEVVPQKSYYGGQEGPGTFTWYRTNRKLQGSELRNISDECQKTVVLGKTPTYTPSLEDVGSYIVLYWVPTRADGVCGDPLVTISNNPVAAALPVVSNVHVKELSAGIYCGEGQYYGGYEGSSLFSWYRETNEGTINLINGANSTTYEVSDSDYNCRLLFGYTPIRSDSVVGELRLSEPTDIVLPELPKIQMLTLTGKAIEGDILAAVEVIPNSVTQQHVWQNYKKDVQYQWFISLEDTENQSFEPLPSQRSCSYKMRLEDIGRCLRCECIVTDVFGRSSGPASAVTSPILPGIPKIDKLEIEGRGFHTNLYAVRGIYRGGKEGKSQIQWLRSMVGSPDLISIPGEIGRMYEANVDDVGYRLVAIYTPVREDGVEGQPVSASTEPIAVEPDVHKEVKQKLELGAVKFETLCDRDRSLKKAPGSGSLERRILEVNRKRVKVIKPGSKTSFPATEIRGSYTPPFHVKLFRNDQHRLKIVVDSENEVDLMVQTRHMRDVIVLVIRGFAQRFNSTSLNSLLNIET